ncbi:MAG: zinc metallopeptidase [Clostridiales bacterium]|nr:zinc metallopeptidase [Clostridiales bacterium]
MLYIVAILVIIYLIFSVVSVFNSSERLEKLYNKYMGISNAKGMSGKDIAFLARKMFDLDVKIARRKGKLTDGYSVKAKVVIMSADVSDSASIASAGIVAHEIGHAVQHKNRTFLFGMCTALRKFNNIFCRFAIPLIVIGAILHFFTTYTSLGGGLIIVALILFFLNILENLLEIPLEQNASAIGFEFLKDCDIIDKKDYKKVKRLLSVASKTYIADFFRQLIPIRRK